MRLREILRTKVKTITPRETAQAAMNRMKQESIRHLVVADGDRVLGVLSDRDVASLGAMGLVETVDYVMSEPVVTASPDTTVRQAANLLRGRTIGCLPVVENGKVVGIVTATDLLELIGEGIERPIPRPRRRVLKARGPRPLPAAGRGRTDRLPAPR